MTHTNTTTKKRQFIASGALITLGSGLLSFSVLALINGMV